MAKSLFQQDIPHAVAPRGMTCEPHRRIERSARENAPVGGAVTQRHLLAGACEEHCVLSYEIPSANHREADVSLPSRVSAGHPMQQDRRIERHATGLRDGVAERERCPGRRIDLVAVVGLDDLDIELVG